MTFPPRTNALLAGGLAAVLAGCTHTTVIDSDPHSTTTVVGSKPFDQDHQCLQDLGDPSNQSSNAIQQIALKVIEGKPLSDEDREAFCDATQDFLTQTKECVQATGAQEVRVDSTILDGAVTNTLRLKLPKVLEYVSRDMDIICHGPGYER